MSIVIDRNRGVITRKHSRTNAPVHMFKDEPGVFRDDRGNLVSDEVAAGAGFDVASLKWERRRAELKAESDAQIDKLVAKEKEKLEERIRSEKDEAEAKASKQASKESGQDGFEPPYRELHRGGGSWAVVDSKDRIFQHGLSKEQAEEQAEKLNKAAQAAEES